jgi:epoxyqueuosine reductase QueG
MSFLNDATFPKKEPKAAIKKDHCDGCLGVCPKEALFIPGLSTKNLRAYLDMALEPIAEVSEYRQ